MVRSQLGVSHSKAGVKDKNRDPLSKGRIPKPLFNKVRKSNLDFCPSYRGSEKWLPGLGSNRSERLDLHRLEAFQRVVMKFNKSI